MKQKIEERKIEKVEQIYQALNHLARTANKGLSEVMEIDSLSDKLMLAALESYIGKGISEEVYDEYTDYAIAGKYYARRELEKIEKQLKEIHIG